jgi:hypothetical protein
MGHQNYRPDDAIPAGALSLWDGWSDGQDRPTPIAVSNLRVVMVMRAASSLLVRSLLSAASPRALLVLVVLGAAPTIVGCFDGATLLEAKQQETNLVRLDEIDLGEFRITLPGPHAATNGGMVEFHAFGQVANRDRAKVAKALKLNEPEFRYRLILLVRSLTEKDLSDPKLKRLRGDLAALANAPLEHHEIKRVGFYKFAFAPAGERVAAVGPDGP